jgi:hypothetical protein
MPRQCLYERWRFRRIAERFAQFSDCVVQTDFEVDEGPCRPETLSKFLTSDDFSRPTEQ